MIFIVTFVEHNNGRVDRTEAAVYHGHIPRFSTLIQFHGIVNDRPPQEIIIGIMIGGNLFQGYIALVLYDHYCRRWLLWIRSVIQGNIGNYIFQGQVCCVAKSFESFTENQVSEDQVIEDVIVDLNLSRECSQRGIIPRSASILFNGRALNGQAGAEIKT